MDPVPDATASPLPTVPPIWILSLARATERRRFVDERFGALGLPFEIIDAVDAQTVDVRPYASPWRSRFEIGRTMSPGDIGCSLSHLAAYRRMVDEEVPAALIVEDDVEPTPELADILAAHAALPPDWQVVTFHSLFASATPKPLPGPPLAGAAHVCTYDHMPFGAQCYLVRRSAAERLLAVGLPIRFPADDLLYRRWPAGLRVYGIEPSPVRHADFGSELGTRPPDDTRGLTRVLARTVVTAGKVRIRVRRAVRR